MVEVHVCECVICQTGENRAVLAHHRHLNLVLSRLEEAQRRWYVAALSTAQDAPSDAMLRQITGVSEKTIQRGRQELEAGVLASEPGRQRRSGAGRPKAEKKTRC